MLSMLPMSLLLGPLNPRLTGRIDWCSTRAGFHILCLPKNSPLVESLVFEKMVFWNHWCYFLFSCFLPTLRILFLPLNFSVSYITIPVGKLLFSLVQTLFTKSSPIYPKNNWNRLTIWKYTFWKNNQIQCMWESSLHSSSYQVYFPDSIRPKKCSREHSQPPNSYS